MDALAGDGGDRRECVSVSLGSVSFGARVILGSLVPVLPNGPTCTMHRCVVVESWLSAKDSVARSMSRLGSASLDRVAGVGTVLLRRCKGSITSFVATVGSSRLAPHICPDIVRHWSGTIKRFPAITQLLRVLSPGSPVCVHRGGNLPTDLDYGSHPSALPPEGAILEKVCAELSFGRALVFDLGLAAANCGLRISPLAVVLEPKFRIVHDLTLERVGEWTRANKDTVFFSSDL